MASFYRNMIENADRSCAKMNLDYPGKPKTPTGGLEKIAMIVGPNSVGKILFSMLAPTMERALTKKCHPQTNVAAMRLKTGLRLYELKHGQLPDRLDALVPDFLKEIPKDPFDDQPLRYSKPDKTVWAVGSDLTDNGGKMENNEKLRDRRGFDLVMPLGTRDLKPTPPPAQNESKKEEL